MNERLTQRIERTHKDCHKLLKQALGYYLPVAGNIGIFCQSEEEYNNFIVFKDQNTYPSDNPNQKYFQLLEPVTISISDQLPKATYTYLYIRKPDPSPYGKYLGDVDFVMESSDYESLVERVENGEVEYASLYDRPGWDTIQIIDPNVRSVAYISTKEFSEKVRVKFD